VVKPVVLLCLSLSAAPALQAQTMSVAPSVHPELALGDQPAARVVVAPASVTGPDYRIGPDDALWISVLQAPELTSTIRVSQQGLISLPLVGTMTASGLTSMDLKRAIEEQLGRKYIKEPDVTVQVIDARSHSVSVVGAVQHPGLVQVPGSTTLLEVISLAGGLATDAGDAVVVLRKGENGAAGGTQELKIKALMDSGDSGLNVPIYPGDVVKVRTADVVYVVGAVNKPGAYAMQGYDRLTVLRALALGEGLTPVAKQGSAVVVRTSARGERVEIPINLKALMNGKTHDVTLEAHDVLFVPVSGSKSAARATLGALVQMITYRPIL
jgi:polysaccharide biosynthesis/export protein